LSEQSVSWSHDLLKTFFRYLAVGTAFIPWGTAYALLAIAGYQYRFLLAILLIGGFITAHFVWRAFDKRGDGKVAAVSTAQNWATLVDSGSRYRVAGKGGILKIAFDINILANTLTQELKVSCEVASSGQRALDTLRNRPVELIFTDFQLPSPKGYAIGPLSEPLSVEIEPVQMKEARDIFIAARSASSVLTSTIAPLKNALSNQTLQLVA